AFPSAAACPDRSRRWSCGTPAVSGRPTVTPPGSGDHSTTGRTIHESPHRRSGLTPARAGAIRTATGLTAVRGGTIHVPGVGTSPRGHRGCSHSLVLAEGPRVGAIRSHRGG